MSLNIIPNSVIQQLANEQQEFLQQHHSQQWAIQARQDLADIRIIIKEIFKQLRNSQTDARGMNNTVNRMNFLIQQMLKYNTKLAQYIPYIQSHLVKQLAHQTYTEAINANHTRISKMLYALELLDEELITELKTYPYSRPETVRDPLSAILTTHAHTANSITTAHLYPTEDVKSSSDTNSTAMGMNDGDDKKDKKERIYTPTVPLETILYMARQYQFYRAGANLPSDLKRHNRSYPPQLLHAGLLIKPIDHLLNDMGSFTL